MKTLLFACTRGAILSVLVCLGLNSCSEDVRTLSSYAESSSILKQNSMDTIMFHVLANHWILSFDDSTEAVLKITVHPGYIQPGQVNPYGTSNPASRGYEVLTALTFNHSSAILLLEGFQPGEYPHNYSFKVYPSIGTYPNLEFDLLYYTNAPTVIRGVFYNKSGVAVPFTGTK